jgi:hypothetical protein
MMDAAAALHVASSQWLGHHRDHGKQTKPSSPAVRQGDRSTKDTM